jgi:archaellum component FlaG (FlaF/FlaG flagellin family)
MKKYFFLACIGFILSATSFAQGKHEEAKAPVTPPAATNNPNAPKLKFAEETYDFGTVVEGPQITHDFKIKNEGKEPLILSNVHASCGCTVPTWPKEPILPGKESVVSATYNTSGRPGHFSKSITIESNATGGNKIVVITGDVIKPEDDKSIPVAKPSMLKTNN